MVSIATDASIKLLQYNFSAFYGACKDVYNNAGVYDVADEEEMEDVGVIIYDAAMADAVVTEDACAATGDAVAIFENRKQQIHKSGPLTLIIVFSFIQFNY